jgi:2-phospho-L-lactate transferase CofD
VRVLVCNAMTEPGETDGYGLAEHLRVLEVHGLPLDALDYLVVHTTAIGPKILDRYAAEGARPVYDDLEPTFGAPTIVRADLLEPDQKVRHAPDKLGPILCHLARHHAAPSSNGTRPAPIPAPTFAK